MSNVPQIMYDDNIYGVRGKDKIKVLEQDSGIFPGSHQNYRVDNVGRSDIYAVLRYGTKISWIGEVTSATIRPGESKVLDNGGRPYYVTGLTLQNNADSRVIVCADATPRAFGSDYYKDTFIDNLLVMKALKGVVSLGVKFIPYVGSTLSALVNMFWPVDKPNVWEQIKEHVEELVDDKVLNAINGILDGDLRQFEERIKVVVLKIEEHNQQAASHYMNIAQDLIGFEKKFQFSSSQSNYKKVNYKLLPLYCQVVAMKLGYYLIGINRASEVGLTSDNVQDLEKYCVRLLRDENGVIKYINDTYKEQVDEVYQTKDPRGIYNGLMETRSYIAVNGLEYIPVWNSMVDNPRKQQNVYNDVISYSTYYGRQTSNLAGIAIPEAQSQPLTPKIMSDGKRNKLKKIIIYIWRIYSGRGEPKIGGMKLIFENDDEYNMGTVSNETHEVELENINIRTLTVWGRGALDYITFGLSNDTEVSFGTKDAAHNYHDKFFMPGHNIVSMYVSSDFSSTGGQANNIAVAYQLENA